MRVRIILLYFHYGKTRRGKHGNHGDEQARPNFYHPSNISSEDLIAAIGSTDTNRFLYIIDEASHLQGKRLDIWRAVVGEL